MKNVKIECKCIDMTVDGFGVCKYESLVIFVKGMIFDEEAIVKIISHKKTLAYGIIDTLIKESPYRRKSICPVAYKCGGCDIRHIDYAYGLKLKRDILDHTMNDMAKLKVEVKDIIPSPKYDHYRNKVQIPVKNGEFGFYRKNSNDIVTFDTCYIQTEEENAILDYLKVEIPILKIDHHLRHIIIKHAQGTGEIMVALIVKTFDIAHIDELTASLAKRFPNIKSILLNENTRDDNVVLGDREKLLYGSSYIVDEFDGLKVEISLKSFYQVNHDQMSNLYHEVLKVSGINEESDVLDLFSGIGTISLYLARYAKKVTGVEIIKDAVENAKANAKLNGITNAEFYLGDAKDGLDEYLKGKDVVVVDPPRKGLHPSIIDKLSEHEIPKIVYVSCNPSTLARDLTLFKEKGYHFDTVQGVDMFPYTTHVECVVLLQRQCS